MEELDAIDVHITDGVMFASLNHPPLNLVGPEILGDLVEIVEHLEQHADKVRVLVIRSSVSGYFAAHADMAQIPALNAALAKAGPGTSAASFYHRISQLPQVTIASIAGRARGAGSELALACDMRFAARETALLGQMEVGVGMIPGAGAAQHLTRLVGRGRALEIMLSADDYSADLAASYGWINKAVPDDELDGFVATLARRIATFAPAGVADTKRRVDEISLPSLEAVGEDRRLFTNGVFRAETQDRLSALFERGMQTDGDLERAFGAAVGRLPAVTLG